ncbi:hypothetical protein [Paraburkholderia fungorum]|jgi:hypothetical protein|uniref:hypothetical protein n=1 Tax=Paraburkholderia fungorum TaxID=134537 RepID=UPI000D42F0A6|nr:hypothetical protein [Paraburkholderia fungorum]PRZ45381.1 hypothetical protein BX589_13960 [Paraburkholderia fungorum]
MNQKELTDKLDFTKRIEDGYGQDMTQRLKEKSKPSFLHGWVLGCTSTTAIIVISFCLGSHAYEPVQAKNPIPATQVAPIHSISSDKKDTAKPEMSKDDAAHIEALLETGPPIRYPSNPVQKYKNYVVIHTGGYDEGTVANVCQINGLNNTFAWYFISYAGNKKWAYQSGESSLANHDNCDYYSRTGQHT